MKKLAVSLFILLLLVGCQKKEEKTTVCRGSDEKTTIVNTIKYIDDRVTSITYENILEVDESLIDYITDYLSQYKESTQDIEGLSYDFRIDGTTIVETTVIDYETADLEQLSQEGFVAVSATQNKTYVGYAITVNQMTAYGYECTEE